jgi:DNA-binding transcriptional ArsR family regulator
MISPSTQHHSLAQLACGSSSLAEQSITLSAHACRGPAPAAFETFRHVGGAKNKTESKGNGRNQNQSQEPHPPLDTLLYFCKHGNMKTAHTKPDLKEVARYADMFSAMGTEPRLRIMQLLLSAHPEGLVVGDIQDEIEIPNSTLSHHLDKLKNEGLVNVQRESTFLRYTANTEVLQELLGFLYAECCTRNKALKPREIIQICK